MALGRLARSQVRIPPTPVAAAAVVVEAAGMAEVAPAGVPRLGRMEPMVVAVVGVVADHLHLPCSKEVTVVRES